MVFDRLGHIGGAVIQRAAFGIDDPQGLAGLEMVLQDNAGAVGEDIEQGVLAAQSPEQ